MSAHNTENCDLYVEFEYLIPEQQVRIFKDSTFSNLVAIGQDVMGVIEIYERNNSGLNGTVIWNGTPVDYMSSAKLTCFESSSSSSSVDSSSSSSEQYSLSSPSSSSSSSSSSISSESSSSSSSSSSEFHSESSSSSSGLYSESSSSSSSSSELYSESSSSSSLCCTYFECNGTGCESFSNWELEGVRSNNTNDCTLYIRFESFVISSTQQVEVYQDPEMTELLSIGQGYKYDDQNNYVITLEERNGSGINGTVRWIGDPVDYENYSVLTCLLDSESSSSSSSID